MLYIICLELSIIIGILIATMPVLKQIVMALTLIVENNKLQSLMKELELKLKGYKHNENF